MKVAPEEKITHLDVAETGFSAGFYLTGLFLVCALLGFGYLYKCEMGWGECKISIEGEEFVIESSEFEVFRQAKSQPCNFQAQVDFFRIIDDAEMPLDVSRYLGTVAEKQDCSFSKAERLSLSLEAYRFASTAGDLRLAESHLKRSIKLDPIQIQAFLYLGDLKSRQANYSQSAEAYRLAIYHAQGMEKFSANSLWDFSQSLIGSDAKCEALEVLRYLNRLTDGQPRITVSLEQLKSQSVCGDQRTESLVLREQDNQIFVPVILNGKEFEFLFDTGATSTILSQKTADNVGAQRGDEWGIVETAGGNVPAYPAKLQSVVLGEDTWKSVDVLVIDDLGLDGILGMEFISRYNISKNGGLWTLSYRY